MYGKIVEWKRQRYLRKLVKCGLTLGSNVYLNDGYFIDPSHCELITIEDGVVFGPAVTVLAHDASTKKLIGKTRVGLVCLKKNCFIGANSTILPGVSVGENSIVGAGSVVISSIPDNEVWAGVPAKRITTVQEFCKRVAALKVLDSNQGSAELARETLAKYNTWLID